MKAEFRQELSGGKLRLGTTGTDRENYEVCMLRENAIRGLAGFIVTSKGSETIYEYDITGLVSLEERYRNQKMNAKTMCEFFEALRETVGELEAYLLVPERILLDGRYIFHGEEGYVFCYLPSKQEEAKKEMTRLMDDFVRWTDEKDAASVRAAFWLHRETVQGRYSLDRICEKLRELRDEEEKRMPETDRIEEIEERKEKEESLFSEPTYDWMGLREMGRDVVREEDDFWRPIRRVLDRRKKSVWGEWGGMHIDEEEFSL